MMGNNGAGGREVVQAATYLHCFPWEQTQSQDIYTAGRWCDKPTISVEMGDRGMAIFSCDIRIPKQAFQNKHSQPCDITVVLQWDELSINCLKRKS